jgi:type III pantothenate kinase
MLLTIDAGNTNVCFAVFKDKDKLASWRASTDIHRTADEWAVWLTHLMETKSINPKEIKAAIISSVVPDLLNSLKTLCRQYFSEEVWVIGDGKTEIGIKALIDNPQEAGADLLVNSVAAHVLYHGPLIVIDFGTATTVSLVDKDGNFCGVAIAPGINLSLEALYKAAAKLPQIAFEKTLSVVGTNTVDSMRAGVFWGYISMIEGLVERIQKQVAGQNKASSPLKVIATGGLAGLIASETKIIDHFNQDLTLNGLQIIYERLKNHSSQVTTLKRNYAC